MCRIGWWRSGLWGGISVGISGELHRLLALLIRIVQSFQIKLSIKRKYKYNNNKSPKSKDPIEFSSKKSVISWAKANIRKGSSVIISKYYKITSKLSLEKRKQQR